MAVDGNERVLESSTDQSSRNNGNLLESFLNKADFERTFKQDMSDAISRLFPSSGEMLAQIGQSDRGSDSAEDTQSGGARARRPRVADRGGDDRADTRTSGDGAKKPVVEKNPDGDVTKVTYPNGDTKAFEYDANHHLTKIKYKNGDYYEKDKNDNWNLHSKHATDSLGQATIRVDREGTLIFHSQDGSRVMITRPDGKIGSVELEQGWVTKVDYPAGDIKQFEYDNDGLTKVKEKNGTYWQKETDGNWKLYDRGGSPTGARMGTIEIEENGDLTMKSVDGKNETITLPNGTVYRKADGRVTHIDKK
jgi:YD repeat-containing protein